MGQSLKYVRPAFGDSFSHNYVGRRPIVFLDWDFTMMPSALIAEQATARALESMELGSKQPSPEAFATAFHSVREELERKGAYRLYSASANQRKELLSSMLRKCGLTVGGSTGVSEQQLRRGVSELGHALGNRKLVAPFKNYEHVVLDMRRHGVPVYVTTFGNRGEQVAKINATGLGKLFQRKHVLATQDMVNPKSPDFYAKALVAVNDDPDNPNLSYVREDALDEAKRILKNEPITLYILGDHPRQDAGNPRKMVDEDSPALRTIWLRRGLHRIAEDQGRVREGVLPPHMAVEDLNQARLAIFSNHGINAPLYPPGVKLEGVQGFEGGPTSQSPVSRRSTQRFGPQRKAPRRRNS